MAFDLLKWYNLHVMEKGRGGTRDKYPARPLDNTKEILPWKRHTISIITCEC